MLTNRFQKNHQLPLPFEKRPNTCLSAWKLWTFIYTRITPSEPISIKWKNQHFSCVSMPKDNPCTCWVSRHKEDYELNALKLRRERGRISSSLNRLQSTPAMTWFTLFASGNSPFQECGQENIFLSMWLQGAWGQRCGKVHVHVCTHVVREVRNLPPGESHR